MPKTQLLVVDDERKLREVLVSYFEARGYAVFAAETGAEALRIFERENIALVLLNLMLPDLPGEEVCAALRRRSAVPILMLTAKNLESDLLNGLSLGADEYVTKPFSLKELQARVEVLLRRCGGTMPLAQRMRWRNGDLEIDFSAREVRRGGRPVVLTPKEWAILAALIRYPKKIFTREELLRAAFEEDYDGFDRVIDTHMKNLRGKLEADPRHPVYLLTVHGVGYKFGGDET
jgi:DNA-binding response OmpR family regulator